MIGSEGQLARRAAERINNENMIEARLEIASLISAVGDLVDDLEWLGPLGAFRLGRCGSELCAIVGDSHQIGDAPVVGGPGDALRAVRQAGNARALAGVHPAHEQLR
jgi:hypothetical protein